MDAPVLRNNLQQSGYISGGKLCELAVFEHRWYNFMQRCNLLKHLRAGGITGLGLFSGRKD